MEEQRAATFLDRDENGEDLDYEDFDLQEDLANIQISYLTPTWITQIPDLPPLQDATTPASTPITTLAVPNVTIPMLQDALGAVPGAPAGTAAS